MLLKKVKTRPSAFFTRFSRPRHGEAVSDFRTSNNPSTIDPDQEIQSKNLANTVFMM